MKEDIDKVTLHFQDVEHETDLAFLVRFEPRRKVWLPKSYTEIVEEPEEGRPGKIETVSWLVTVNELDSYVDGSW